MLRSVAKESFHEGVMQSGFKAGYQYYVSTAIRFVVLSAVLFAIYKMFNKLLENGLTQNSPAGEEQDRFNFCCNRYFYL